MRRRPRVEAQAAEELERTRRSVIAYMRAGVGGGLTDEEAERLLTAANGWGPQAVRSLAEHFSEFPESLASPSRHAPLPLVRLLHLLHAAGHQDAVAKLACVSCGRTDPLPLTSSSAGRCCGWCWAKAAFRACGRCGQVDHIVTSRDGVAVCRRCYRQDGVEECAGCGRLRYPGHRLPDGGALCTNCTPRKPEACSGCGKVKKVSARTPAGPVCSACYSSPPRLCGMCGQLQPIQVRAAGDQPDICIRCYRGPKGECMVCGRLRHGGHVGARGGTFHCRTCWPLPRRTCSICHRSSRAQAIWPLGPVCETCYKKRRTNPAPCPSCGNARIMIGIAADGAGLCAACCGRDDPAARCAMCRNPGDLAEDGKCPRCRLIDRVRDLLTPSGAPMPDDLAPLATVLCEAANPYPVLAWLRRSRAAKTLARLAEQPEPFTHQLLDQLPQNAPTRHICGLLVTAGILPRRDEHLARLQLWIHQHLPGLPSHQAALIRPFAEWQVMRDARHRSARGRYTLAASKTDIREIRTAIRFLTWLDQQQLTAATTSQADLDLWTTRHPATHRPLASFIRWLRARRINTDLDLRPEQRAFAATFLTEDDYTRHLHRCLTDETLPRDVRILGALTLLYALPVSRITELTTDRYHRDDTGAYLTLGRHPVLLPPRLAQLIEAQIHQPATGRFRALLDDGTHYLLPGQAPTRSRNPLGATALLRSHDIPTLAGRNTALLEAVSQMPPIVVADLFGLHPQTATSWARHANDSWTHYLAARQ